MAAAPTGAAPVVPRRRHAGRALLRGLAAGALAGLLALGWLLGSESGLRSAVRVAAWASDGRLSVQGASGRLLGNVAVQRLVYADTAFRLEADTLQLRWRPGGLFSARLLIDELSAADLAFAAAPRSGDDTATPPQPPHTLRLPLALQIDRLALGRLRSLPWMAPQADEASSPASEAQLLAEALQLRFISDGRLHRLERLAVVLPGAELESGPWVLEGDAPFAVSGSGRLQGRLDTHAFSAGLQLSGDLRAPLLRLQAEGEGLSGEAMLQAAPFEAMPLRQLQLALRDVDPALFVAAAPTARLALQAELAPLGEAMSAGLAGRVQVDNAQPGRVDEGRLPLIRLATRLHWQPDQLRLDELALQLPGEARVTGMLAWTAASVEAGVQAWPGSLSARLQLDRVDPARLHAAAPALPMSGQLVAQATAAAQQLQLALQAAGAQLQAELALNPVAHAAAPSAGAGAGPLSAAAAPAFDFSLSAQLRRLDPRRFDAGLPAALLGLDVQAEGRSGPAPEARVQFGLVDSRWAGQALAGDGQLALASGRLTDSRIDLQLAGNRLQAAGAWGRAGDRLTLRLDAPRLAALAQGLEGRAGLSAQLGGDLDEPSGEFTLFAEALRLPGGLALDGLNAQGWLEAGLDGRFQLALGLSGLRAAPSGEDVQAGEAWLEAARLSLNGRRADHRIELAVLRGGDRLDAGLRGALVSAAGGQVPGWRGSLERLESAGRFPARLAAPVVLEAGPQRVELAEALIEAGEQGRIRLLTSRWTPAAAQLRGALNGLSFGLQARADGRPRRGPGPLTLGAEWDLRLAETVEGDLRVFRESGDLQVSGEISTRIGLEHLEARLSAQDSRLALSLDARGSELGSLSGAVSAAAERSPEGGWRLRPDAALLGSACLDMPSIAWLGRLLRENVETAGRLQAAFSFAGTPAEPLASGRIEGHGIALTLVDQGLQLSGGELVASFDRDRLRLQRLAFVSPNRVRPRDSRPPLEALTATPGVLEARGEIALDSGAGQFDFRADRLPLLQRPDRWLILSGQGQAASTWNTLDLSAGLRADAGYIELGDTPAPSLSDDVVVLGREPAGGGGMGVSADVQVGLGEHLYLSAFGLDTRLTGALRLQQAPGRALSATGTIATAGGVFRGYGQNLAIERGLINFQGELDNPGLNVVALRKGLAVEAGVAIGGSARRPQLRLVSEPEVPDPDKLSWIVLGRAPDAGGGADLGLLLPAAQALLGGPGGGMTEQLSRSLGFDEFSIGQGEVGGVSRRATSRVVGSGTVVDGAGMGGQVLSVGKRLSADVFLSFQQSLGGAESLVKLSYQLSRHVALVARGGTDNALDVYYTLSFR